ncbi:MAG: hypothetical protein AAFP03_05865 [Cyanobacteria bacterium J06598_3]
MRPPICYFCNASASEGGERVKFADYVPLESGMVGHPRGLEWFCAKHLAAAQQLSHLPAAECRQRYRQSQQSDQ